MKFLAVSYSWLMTASAMIVALAVARRGSVTVLRRTDIFLASETSLGGRSLKASSNTERYLVRV